MEEEGEPEVPMRKFADKTEEFRKAKATLLWFSAVLVVLAVSGDADLANGGVAPYADVRIPKEVLTGMLWCAVGYYLVPFAVEGWIQASLNQQLANAAIRGSLLQLHRKYSDVLSSALSRAKKLKEQIDQITTEERWKEVADQNIKGKISEQSSRRMWELQEQCNQIENEVQVISTELWETFQNVSDHVDWKKQDNKSDDWLIKEIAKIVPSRDRHLEALAPISKQIKKILSDNNRGFGEDLSKVQILSEIETVGKSQLSKPTNECISSLVEMQNQIESMKSDLSKFGDFEVWVSRIEKFRILVWDLFVPSILAILAMLLGFDGLSGLFELVVLELGGTK